MKFPVYFLAAIILFVQLACGQTVAKQESHSIAKSKSLLWTTDWSRDDQLIAIGGDDSLLRIYEGKHFKPVMSFKMNSMIRQVSWHPEKNILAIATNDNDVSIYDITTKGTIKLEGITNGARGIGWNYSGELLATADNDGLVKIWNSRGRLLKTIKKDDDNSYFSLHWHPHKNIVAVSGDDIRIMDTSGTTLKVIKHRKENTGILAVRWHPSGEFLASGDYGHDNEGVRSIIQFWSPDGILINTLYGSNAEYRNIQWNKDGTLLASCSDALRIWNKNGDLLFTGASNDLLWGIDWNTQSNQIITTSIEGHIKLWSAKAVLIKEIAGSD